MEQKFRVVKLTRLSGDIYWAVQKLCKGWLTGKLRWKYYADYSTDSMYTKNPSDAKVFYNENAAVDKMNELIEKVNSRVIDVQPVVTVTTDELGNLHEEG